MTDDIKADLLDKLEELREVVGMTDEEPVLWINAVGVESDEIDVLGEKISEAVNEDYSVVVASEPISLLSREELLDELREP